MFKAFLCVFMIFSMMSKVALADSYYVDDVTGEAATRNGGELGSTLRGLVENEVVNQGQSVSQDPASSQWILSPKIYKLGDAYIMTLSKSQNGKVVSSQKLKSKTQGELDVVTEQLVRSVIGNKKISNAKKLDLNNKQEVTRQFYFGFGPGSLSGLETDNSGFSWAVGYLWGLDPRFSLRLNLEGLNASDSGADKTMLGLGGQYYLNELRHAPYVLGLIGHSWSDSEDASACASCTGDSEHGWAGEVGLGMHFYRNATVNLAVELTHMRGFYDVNDSNPGATSLKMIILW